MKALAGWMAALMLAAAPAAFGDELPPGVEVQQAPGAQPQQQITQVQPEEETDPAPAPEAQPEPAPQAQDTQPRQSPQTGDSSLLALAGLGVSALVLAAARKGALDPGKNPSIR